MRVTRAVAASLVIVTAAASAGASQSTSAAAGSPQPFANVLRVGGTIPQPQKIKHVPPAYPAEALAAGIQGLVIVDIVIGTQGVVEDTRVLRSVPGLDGAAVAAIRQWVYTPTLVKGEPVRVAWTVTQNFVVPPREAPLAGEWRDSAAAANGVARAVIRQDGGAWRAHVWTACPAAECDLGEQSMVVVNGGDPTAIVASGIWTQGPVTRSITFSLKSYSLLLDIRQSIAGGRTSEFVSVLTKDTPPSTELPPASATSTPPVPVRVGGSIPKPTKLTHVDPIYPADAMRNRIEGVVVLELVLSTDGRVEKTTVLRSVPGLDDAAVRAVQQWRYSPTVLNGVSQRVIYTVTVTFQMSNGGASNLPPGSIQETRVFRVGGGILAPRLVKGGAPKYPEAAKSKGIEGTVVLELTILPDGRVTHARVVKSIKELDDAALDAAMRWEYTPTIVAGARVTVLYEVEVPFSMPR